MATTRDRPAGTAASRRAAGTPRPAPARATPAALQALQRSAGNAAVASAVQRLDAGGSFAEPAKPVGTAPHDDPRFLAVKGRIAAKGAALKRHPAARTEAKRAQDAALAPADDKQAQVKAAQADTMSGAKPGGFDKAGFVAAVKQAIAAQAPKNLDEASKFGDSGKAEAVKAQVAGKVTEGKDKSTQDIAEKTAQPPDESKAVDKPVTPLVPDKPPAPGGLDAAKAMPAAAPPEQTDLSGGKRETDSAMASADVTEQQLAASNEPEFTGALDAKKEGEQHSATAPVAVRESEAAKLDAARQAAGSSGQAGLAGLVQAKGASLARSNAGKSAAKAKDEAARAQIAAQVKAIFDGTKKDVDAILGGLDKQVADRFDAGEKAAREAFTADHKARMSKYKSERYSGFRGKLRWVRDKFAGLPEEANQIFAESRKLYEAHMERVISTVADFVGGELTRAKDRIAQGRAEIKQFVAKQPRDLRRFANEASQQFAAQFDQLESDVDSKRDALVDDLANKYSDARKSVDEEIQQLQEENKGLWDKVKNAVVGVIQTILKLKDMLLSVLARAAAAIGNIIKHPIQFLGNFVSAVKTGIVNFAHNIGEHLKRGLQSWLLGSLGEAGIQLPEKFDLKGIVQLVLSLLGLTWQNIRARIVRVIPERVMGVVEKSVGFIQVILTEGVGGLWKWVVAKLSDLKEMVMSQIREFVITKIVKAGITWLISLLNPAAAFIKACKMIYDAVMFFVEKAAQIKEFVDSILDSIESIASGGVGAVAGYIEKTLAKMIPLLLGFLANLLGLGGISDQIKKILQTVQKPVMSVVDKLIAGAVRLGKGLLRKLGFGKRDKDKRNPAEQKAAVHAARRAAEAMLKRSDASAASVAEGLPRLKQAYGLTTIALKALGRGKYAIEAKINPEERTDEVTLTASPIPDRRYLPPKAFGKNWIRSRLYISGGAWETIQTAIHKIAREQCKHLLDYIANLPRNMRPEAREQIILSVAHHQLPPSALQAFDEGRLKPDFIDDLTYDVDHKGSIVEHWVRGGGNNTSDATRKDHATSLKSLKWITRPQNESKGSKSESGERFEYKDMPWVGPEFTSGRESADRKSIAGERYRDEKGAPLA